MEFKDRLKKLRKEKGLSQRELCKIVGIHITNISRYERGENKPTADVMKKIADVLGVTTDYLMYGSIDDKAKQSISDRDLLLQFQRVEKLPDDKKTIVKELIESFLLKIDLQEKLAH